MAREALEIIRREHRALAAMLRAILQLLEQHRREATPPDFAALRAMLCYVDEFPEQRHHRKESELLFPKLRARTPLHRDLLDHLDQDHSLGERRIRELEHALLTYEIMGPSRRAHFEATATRYVDFYLRHMALEDEQILPLATRVLSAQDWQELDEAFVENRDFLAGAQPEAAYTDLFSRIARLVPALLELEAAAH